MNDTAMKFELFQWDLLRRQKDVGRCKAGFRVPQGGFGLRLLDLSKIHA